jgi:RNA polymerase sigma factor (sigma-70 family)
MEPGLPKALKGLSQNQRVTVFLVHAMGWTRRETADMLGISTNSVGSHLDRGLAKLRTALGVRIDD